MEDEAKAWLLDIKQAIAEVESFLPSKKDFFQFQKDLNTRRAIERNIEIIGEAGNRVLKRFPETNISDIKKIVDTRNRIIHGYDTVSDNIVWSIITNSLPRLKSDIETLLAN